MPLFSTDILLFQHQMQQQHRPIRPLTTYPATFPSFNLQPSMHKPACNGKSSRVQTFRHCRFQREMGRAARRLLCAPRVSAEIAPECRRFASIPAESLIPALLCGDALSSAGHCLETPEFARQNNVTTFQISEHNGARQQFMHGMTIAQINLQ